MLMNSGANSSFVSVSVVISFYLHYAVSEIEKQWQNFLPAPLRWSTAGTGRTNTMQEPEFIGTTNTANDFVGRNNFGLSGQTWQLYQTSILLFTQPIRVPFKLN
jgi:hypothetical protein